MNAQYYRAQISQLVPINTLGKKNFEALLEKVKIRTSPQGIYLFREGDVDKRHVYLLDGSVEVYSSSGERYTVEPGSEISRNPLAHHQPRKHTARTTSDVTVLEVESKTLDMMLTWDQVANYVVEEINEQANLAPGDWMGRMLASPVFRQIPPVNLQQLFQRLKPVRFGRGDVVVAQGEPGDYFYVLASGRAVVMRVTAASPKGAILAELGPGDFFGEDALFSSQPRNATVRMVEEGTLMRLSKEDFMALLREPVIDWITYPEAAQLVKRRRAVWLDVRQPNEFKHDHLENAFNLPLNYVRAKAGVLKPQLRYICYCDTGGRSSAAAFLLKRHGLDARVLKGGIGAVYRSPPTVQMKIA